MGAPGGRTRLRRLLVPTISTIALVAVALGLGVWQVERLAWKTALLGRIDAAEASAAVPFSGDPAQFTKVAVSGTYRQTAAARYGTEVRDTPSGPRIGARLIQPLDRPGAPPILIDRGWAPTGLRVSIPAGRVTIEGYIRTADRPVWFAAADDPAARRFYTLDPVKIAAALGVEGAAPFVLVALAKPDGKDFPQPATALPRPPNDHFSYAVTWFSLAAVLIVMFVIYARKVLRP